MSKANEKVVYIALFLFFSFILVFSLVFLFVSRENAGEIENSSAQVARSSTRGSGRTYPSLPPGVSWAPIPSDTRYIGPPVYPSDLPVIDTGDDEPFDLNDLPEDFDYSNFPGNFDFENNLPADFDFDALPADFDFSFLPDDFDFGDLPEGFDYSQLTEGVDLDALMESVRIPSEVVAEKCADIDVNGDGVLSLIDMAAFAEVYNLVCETPPDLSDCGSQDANMDGIINLVDLGSFAERYQQVSCELEYYKNLKEQLRAEYDIEGIKADIRAQFEERREEFDQRRSDLEGSRDEFSGLIGTDPAQIVACTQDSDCVSVPQGCCGCSEGGRNIAVNRQYADQMTSLYDQRCTETVCTQVNNCADFGGTPSCNNGTCVLPYYANDWMATQPSPTIGFAPPLD